MITIYLCDDEKEITTKAAKLIKEYFISYPEECYLEIFNSGKELLGNVLKNKKADVIFLDIELTDSNGIEIARAIRRVDKKVKIVFLTNYKNYKGAAFTVRAFGYVEKPFTKKEIYAQIIDIQNYSLEEKKEITLKFDTKDGLINIAPKDIIYFESKNRKVEIVTFTTHYVMAQRIPVLTKAMERYNFRSPHSSFLINLDYVIDVKNYFIYMINNIEIPLSQRKSTEFRQELDAFLEQTIDSCKGVYHV
ncbi:MAG: LytTR family DNA-binding domain-containing protein [Lachnospiraceae bacterium]